MHLGTNFELYCQKLRSFQLYAAVYCNYSPICVPQMAFYDLQFQTMRCRMGRAQIYQCITGLTSHRYSYNNMMVVMLQITRFIVSGPGLFEERVWTLIGQWYLQTDQRLVARLPLHIIFSAFLYMYVNMQIQEQVSLQLRLNLCSIWICLYLNQYFIHLFLFCRQLMTPTIRISCRPRCEPEPFSLIRFYLWQQSSLVCLYRTSCGSLTSTLSINTAQYIDCKDNILYIELSHSVIERGIFYCRS